MKFPIPNWKLSKNHILKGQKSIYKGANFHEYWPYRTQVMTISLDTENSKWQIWKKALKLPKFQKSISQEWFSWVKKLFSALLFLSGGNIWAKFGQNLKKMGDKIENFVSLWHRIVQFWECQLFLIVNIWHSFTY